jgi:putative PEP-CTERM system response regulator
MMPKHTILIVDDEPDIREILKDRLEGYEYRVITAQDGYEALDKVSTEIPDLTLLDIRLPGMDGMEVLQKMKEADPDTLVVMITAFGTIELAVKAMKHGAYDFITKPLEPSLIELTVTKALERKTLIDENKYLREEIQKNIEMIRNDVGVDEIIGKSESMQELLRQAAKVAPTNATILVQGETGTGKELIAKIVHHLSPRKKWPFVVVNCGAIPANLLESELFGHEKGSFTGAYALQKGKFELANAGTIFLDEVGEIPLALQVKLLRFLENGIIERIGGEKPMKTNVRIMAATNKNLSEEMQKGRFREDLFYRLNVVVLSIPPLRDRGSDASLLADYFLRKFTEKYNKVLKGFTPEAMSFMSTYSWPGNVRELEHKIERAVIMSENVFITPQDLDMSLGDKKSMLLKKSKADLEIHLLRETLSRNKGNISRSAHELGISRKTLYNMMKRYHVKPDNNS